MGQPNILLPMRDLSQPDPVEARLQLAAIVDSSDDAIISKDLQGIITTWNAAATRLFGYRPHEIIGRSVLTLIPEELHSEEPEILRKVTAGERIEHFETRRRRKNGELFQISLTISPIRDSSGRIVGISKIARDITERKLTEAALFESERMAAIGRLAGSIAHEVNNPLEAILNLAYLLEQHPSLDDEARAYTHLLLGEVVRVGEITRRTLSFYRDTSHPVELDMTALVDGVLKLHQPLLDQKYIRLVTRFGRPAYVWGRPGELRQVVTNLIGNAIDALPQGGIIRVGVTCGAAGQGARISISDNGPGIPQQLRQKIFEPFFSTKQAKGTGLGLWISQSIIRKFGGHIRLRSWTDPCPKTGTVFVVSLPAHC
ncbi:MAG: PAS domain S-box protein [Acidobacteriota bacterium]|nr:PAS domain S-box protein [Acidobacteriota bacterium]